MANELLTKINEAEIHFEEKTQNAKAEAQKIIDGAFVEAQKISESKMREADNLSDVILTAAKRKSEELIENGNTETQTKVSELIKRASLNESAAVLAVTKKMLELS